MGDRVYANVRFGGLVNTVEDFKKLCAAILKEGAHQETDKGITLLGKMTDVQEALLEFVASGVTPLFAGEEVNRGIFQEIERVCAQIELWSWTYFCPGIEFSEGEKVIRPDGVQTNLWITGGTYTVYLADVIRCRNAANPMAAFDALIDLSGAPRDFPPFNLSDEVLTHFAPDLARLKIAGKAV